MFKDTFEAFKAKIRREAELEKWMKMTLECINYFAQAKGDFQSIHLDLKRAEAVDFWN